MNNAIPIEGVRKVEGWGDGVWGITATHTALAPGSPLLLAEAQKPRWTVGPRECTPASREVGFAFPWMSAGTRLPRETRVFSALAACSTHAHLFTPALCGL